MYRYPPSLFDPPQFIIQRVIQSPSVEITGPQGSQGSQGERGLTVTGPRGAQGSQGDRGVGIEDTVQNEDTSVTFTYGNSTSFTTIPLRGAQGVTGITGATGLSGIFGPTYYFAANKTEGDQSVTSEQVYIITYDTSTATLGTGTQFSSTQYTASVTGFYEFESVVQLGSSTGGTAEISYLIGGVPVYTVTKSNVGSSERIPISIPFKVFLNTNDSVSMQIAVTGAGDIIVYESGTRFSGNLVERQS